MDKSRRSIVYIDGFNLYYGALKHTNYKWLNLESYFKLLRQHDDIKEIKFFSAVVKGSSATRQLTYWRALHTLPLVNIIRGKFKNKKVKCEVRTCTKPEPRWFICPEEKRTDVSIGLHMLADAMNDICDILVLVTGDSDLVPAIQMVKTECPKKEIVVYIPARNDIRGAAVELRNMADKDKTLPNTLFKHSQFPVSLVGNDGEKIVKPTKW